MSLDLKHATFSIMLTKEGKIELTLVIIIILFLNLLYDNTNKLLSYLNIPVLHNSIRFNPAGFEIWILKGNKEK